MFDSSKSAGPLEKHYTLERFAETEIKGRPLMVRQYKRKTRRKTTSPKLNSTGVVTDSDLSDWMITLDWEKLEAAYGVRLPKDARVRVAEIVRNFRWQDHVESMAPTSKSAIAAIDHLHSKLSKIAQWLTTRESATEKTAILVLDQVVSGRKLATFHAILALIAACEESKSRLRQSSADSGYQEGGAWKNMIRGLLGVACEYKLPDKVAKPTGGESSGYKPSPFIRFVEVLQTQIPDAYWPFPSTPVALATAIGEVRKRAPAKEHIAPQT